MSNISQSKEFNMTRLLRRPGNKTLYFLYNILYTTGFMFCSGTILQTFMLNVGMTDAEVSTYNAVIQIVQTGVIFAMAFLADKIRRVLKVYASIILSVSIIAVSLVFCVFVRSDLDTVKWIIFGSSIVTYFMIGVRNGVDYRIYYDIFDMRDVGSMMGAAIAISGLVSFGISVAYSFMVKKLDYYDVMTMFFILSAVMLILSSAACFSYKKINNTPVAEKKKGLELAAFKNKTTIFLAFPSLLRGLASGIIALITVVGISGGILNTETATYVSILTQVTTFGGNMLYSIMCRRVKNRVTLILACIMIGIALPLSVVGGDLVTFLIGFAFTNFAYVIVNISIPILACEIVPYEQIGSFTCIRMMLFTLGSVISSLVYKPLADSIGFFWLFIAAGVIQILCGIMHFIVSKKSKTCDQNTETNETKTGENENA